MNLTGKGREIAGLSAGSWGLPTPADPLNDDPARASRTGGKTTEDELVQGYAGAARTAQDGREPEELPRVPVDWDLAVGEPVARGRTREKETGT